VRIRSLIKSFLSTIQKRYSEILQAHYDFDSGDSPIENGMPIRFNHRNEPILRKANEGFDKAAKGEGGRAGKAGEATLRRGIFLQSLVSGEGRERSELLEQLELWNRAYVTSGNLDRLFAPDQRLAKVTRFAQAYNMTNQDTLTAAGYLREFGFKSDPRVISDHGLGMSYDFGDFKLSAGFVRGNYFQDVVLFTGFIQTPRTLAHVEFEISCHELSSELCAAYIAYHLDKIVSGSTFVPEKESPWLVTGRANKHLLPWEKQWQVEREMAEIQARIYRARPHCTVERKWLRLALNSLADYLTLAADDEPVKFDFHGSVLCIRCMEREIVVGAKSDSLGFHCSVPAGKLRMLPKRLMSENVDVSIWMERLQIDRCRYDGLVELDPI
jgi:hypothetical protein